MAIILVLIPPPPLNIVVLSTSHTSYISAQILLHTWLSVLSGRYFFPLSLRLQLQPQQSLHTRTRNPQPFEFLQIKAHSKKTTTEKGHRQRWNFHGSFCHIFCHTHANISSTPFTYKTIARIACARSSPMQTVFVIKLCIPIANLIFAFIIVRILYPTTQSDPLPASNTPVHIWPAPVCTHLCSYVAIIYGPYLIPIIAITCDISIQLSR